MKCVIPQLDVVKQCSPSVKPIKGLAPKTYHNKMVRWLWYEKGSTASDFNLSLGKRAVYFSYFFTIASNPTQHIVYNMVETTINIYMVTLEHFIDNRIQIVPKCPIIDVNSSSLAKWRLSNHQLSACFLIFITRIYFCPFDNHCCRAYG